MACSLSNEKPSKIPYAKLIKEYTIYSFFEYFGKVDVVMDGGLLSYVRLVKPENGDDICQFDRKDNDVLTQYKGKTIRILGKYNRNTGLVKAHIKKK
ncbi:MAG: hypothetical protein V1678_01230 [Candidatus Aenigmatarchaeota archaeon]